MLDIISEKKALVIFYNHIEDCRAELGTKEIVAALIYALYDYDKAPDKDKYKMPTFKDYDKEQAAAARMIFRNMATAARENMNKSGKAMVAIALAALPLASYAGLQPHARLRAGG